jgi:hypothetical protein
LAISSALVSGLVAPASVVVVVVVVDEFDWAEDAVCAEVVVLALLPQPEAASAIAASAGATRRSRDM